MSANNAHAEAQRAPVVDLESVRLDRLAGGSRLGARRRHPTAAWRPDQGRLEGRIAEELARLGRPHPGVGAAVLALRGRSGLDRDTFARRLRVSPERLADAEGGLTSADRLPAGLRRALAG